MTVSDAGLPVYRELGDALGLTAMVDETQLVDDGLDEILSRFPRQQRAARKIRTLFNTRNNLVA